MATLPPAMIGNEVHVADPGPVPTMPARAQFSGHSDAYQRYAHRSPAQRPDAQLSVTTRVLVPVTVPESTTTSSPRAVERTSYAVGTSFRVTEDTCAPWGST